ncbi:AAA family ATPase [Tenacibaculum maritimum]|uniref:AAA family ATPase n=1 Tax=Tenacibaculum maritimum TaxID=107401 RepID=UPI00387736A4
MDIGHLNDMFNASYLIYLIMAKKDTNNLDSAFGEIITPDESDFNLNKTPKALNTAFGDVIIPSENEIRENLKFIKPIAKKNKTNTPDFSDSKYSALNLFKTDFEEIPTLLDPVFPKQGLVSLIGSSDTGKSTFLRQFALSIALGLDEFVDYKLNPKTQNVIFISTEDDPNSVSSSIKKPLKKLLSQHKADESLLNHLKFVFDVDLTENSENNIIKILNKDLSEKGADLIIVDAFTDIFSGDINSSTKVREFLNLFSKISKEYECLILFLHHTGKKTDKFSASKNNALGSQAFEAKMRVMLELKHHPHNDMQRTLTITKGNYISTEIKKYSKVLDFNEENLLFTDTGSSLLSESLYALSKTNPKKNNLLPQIEKLYNEGNSIRKIEAILKSQGHKIGKSSISNYLKEIKEQSANIIGNNQESKEL